MCRRGGTSPGVSPTRSPRAPTPGGSTEFPRSRKTTSWPSMTARTQRRVVRWNAKSEPLSTRVILPRSNGPRIRSRVGTRVVRAGRAWRWVSGVTRASATRAMESSPRFDDDGGIKCGAEGRWPKVPRGTPRRGVTLKTASDDGSCRDAMVEIDPFFLIVFGGPIAFLLFLVVWVLRKPLLAVTPATPDAVRRDPAYRIRGIGYPVNAP